MGREDELFDKYMLIRQMADAVRNKNTAADGPLGDTSRGKGRVFSLLKQKDGVSTKELASIMGIRVSSLNEVLGKMENEGYIERVASPADRRVMLVWLTEKGKEIELPEQRMPEILFGMFEQGAQNQLCMYFEQMIASLQNELEDETEALKQARTQRTEFFESAKQEQQQQQEQQVQAAQAVQQAARPVSAPTAPQGGVPFAPPSAPVSAPPRVN